MTREEFRDYVELLRSQDEISYDVYSGLVDMIDTLEQEPCDDVVSLGVFEQVMWERDVAIEQLKELGYGFGEKPKTGRWLHRENMDYLDKNKVVHNQFMCQDCGFIHDFIDGHTAQYKYCPSCGAKMVEPQESEDKE